MVQPAVGGVCLVLGSGDVFVEGSIVGTLVSAGGSVVGFVGGGV